MKIYHNVIELDILKIQINMRLFLSLYVHLAVLIAGVDKTDTKYVEGHLKTLNDWAFLARFCFFSRRGRYEYIIEYEKRYGDLQLLLYYDDKTQWPAVYKTTKTCKEKLSVLSLRDNQIVTLSSRPPHNLYSGCTLRSTHPTTTMTPVTTNPKQPKTNTFDPQYFDQFIKTTTTPTWTQEVNTMGENNITTDLNDNSTDISTMTHDVTDSNTEDIRRNTSLFKNEVEELFVTHQVQNVRTI